MVNERMEFSIEKCVKLICTSGREVISLQKGITEQWKICTECGTIICPKCLVDLSLYSEKMCLGSRATFSHKIKPDQIPLHEILLYAYKVRDDIYQDPVYQLFNQDIKDPFSTMISQIHEFDPIAEKSILNSREQFWRQARCIYVRFPQYAILDLNAPQGVQIQFLDFSKEELLPKLNSDDEDTVDENSLNMD
jgi:hypothetical protein